MNFGRSVSETGWICAACGSAALLFFIIRAIVKVTAARRRRRELRFELMREAKLCVKCGYDVRGCRDRCAECGEPIQPNTMR